MTSPARMADRYEGVLASGGASAPWLAGSKNPLKTLYSRLPSSVNRGDRLAMTDRGFAVYRTRATDALVFYRVRIQADGEVDLVRPRARHEASETSPPDEFGDGWHISPRSDS